MVAKEELLQKFFAKNVIKNKMVTVVGQMLIKYGKELDNLNQIVKGYEVYIGDNKFKNDILDKVCEDNMIDICSERDEVYENISINRFFQILSNKKREMLSNK